MSLTPATPHPASLIIGTRDRPEMLEETVRSILSGDEVPSEIVIIDQSTETHAALADLRHARGCDVRYIWSRTAGLSRANNLGVAAARHELLVFTHDDVLVAPEWFGSILRALASADTRTAVTGRILASAEAATGGYAPTLRESPAPAVYEGRIGYDVLKPLNMAMRKSALAEVGGFDERLGPGTPYPGAEDADLGLRLLEAGYRIVYAPEAVVYHRAWRSEAEYLPLRWHYGFAQGAFYAKHLRARDPYIARRIVMDVLRRVKRFPRRLIRERRRAFADPVFVAGNVAGMLHWTYRRFAGRLIDPQRD